MSNAEYQRIWKENNHEKYKAYGNVVRSPSDWTTTIGMMNTPALGCGSVTGATIWLNRLISASILSTSKRRKE